jgi:hypothetical protein
VPGPPDAAGDEGKVPTGAPSGGDMPARDEYVPGRRNL